MIILNLGCGSKTSTAPEVVNIDWSIALRIRKNSFMRMLAPILMRGDRFKRFKSLPANALDWIESHECSFDLISGLDIIEHFHKLEVLRFLDVCYKVLKWDGRLILQTPNTDSSFGSVCQYGDFSHEVGFNPNALSRLLPLTGFQRIESRETRPIAIGHSLKSSIHYLIWQVIRSGMKLWNLGETGGAGSGVLRAYF